MPYLTDVADDCTAHTGTSFHENGSSAGAGVVELFLSEHKGGVTVLGRVAVVCSINVSIWPVATTPTARARTYS
jgi:hypothetical protein